jgi:hypothetical protein
MAEAPGAPLTRSSDLALDWAAHFASPTRVAHVRAARGARQSIVSRWSTAAYVRRTPFIREMGFLRFVCGPDLGGDIWTRSREGPRRRRAVPGPTSRRPEGMQPPADQQGWVPVLRGTGLTVGAPYFVPAAELLPYCPHDLLAPSDVPMLGRLTQHAGVTEFELVEYEGELSVVGTLALWDELTLDLPLVDGLQLVLPISGQQPASGVHRTGLRSPLSTTPRYCRNTPATTAGTN